MSDLVGNPEDRFSHVAAQMSSIPFPVSRQTLIFLLLINSSLYGSLSKNGAILVLDVFSQARCPRFAFSMYNISFRGALLEPHAISRFRVRYLQKRDARSAILSIFTVSLGQGK